jgi:YacP-like NYN domain
VGYVVDGNNLGGLAAGAGGARDPAAIVALLLPWARRRRRVVVVFDGAPSPAVARQYGPLAVRFAAPQSADEAILAVLGSRARDWCVVSDDRALLAACRDRGARTMPAHELLPQLLARPREPADERREGAVDVADWEAWFRGGGEG